jgi:phosphate ABC transporter phosphate-binding protein
MRLLRLTFGTSLFLALSLTLGCGGAGSQSAPRIHGGGATFVDPIMQKWSGTYNRQKGVEIDYVAKGSGYGIEQMTDRNIDFGCSDAPMKKEQLAKAKEKGGDVIHVPVVVGAVAVVYSVPDVTAPLRLTGEVLADIYRKDESVRKWNASRIQLLNPNLTLPDKDIVVVARAESSGTTNIFSEYLTKSNDKFKTEIGTGTKPKWPQGVVLQEQNDGVAGFVKGNPGAIGYVELTFAKKNGLPVAMLKNKSDEFVGPDGDGASAAALEAIKTKPTTEPYSLHELTYSLTDLPGKTTYPISGMSYAILFAKQPKDKGPAIVAFLKWAVTEGQGLAKSLDYSPLPEEIQKKAQERLDKVTFE